jgi:hypothetical protein
MSDAEIPLPAEYLGNPFIEATGSLRSLSQRYREMAVLPPFSKTEREEHPVFRRLCCLRLLDAYFPHSRQVLLSERIHNLVLDGYRRRSPQDGSHQAYLAESTERMESGNEAYTSDRDLERIASSSVLLGAPGLGKTRTARRTLASFERVRRHVITPGFMTQVTALQIECPAGRGVKQAYKNFFARLDQLISGAGYLKKFGRDKLPAETMLLHVQHLCHVHAIGLLVIDEIQNLLDASADDKKELMKFIVLLINTVGIPVLLMGTCEATEIFHAGLHAARRGDAVGSDVWDPLPNDGAWHSWLEKLWHYQWTNIRTPLSRELVDAMHDQSQGIPDLAVKLYMLTQLELIAASEASAGTGRQIEEVITPDVIKTVAANRFKMVAPMLSALRANDHEALNKFRDISGFQASMNAIFADLAGMRTEEYESLRRKEEAEAQIAEEKKSFPEIRASLLAIGLKPAVIDRIMVKAETEVPTGDMFAMVDVARRLAEEEKAKLSERSKRLASTKRDLAPVDDPADVRNKFGIDAKPSDGSVAA